MKQTVSVLAARLSVDLRPDRVTQHQVCLLPNCACKQSAGPLATRPTVNNTFLLGPIRPLLFPTASPGRKAEQNKIETDRDSTKAAIISQQKAKNGIVEERWMSEGVLKVLPLQLSGIRVLVILQLLKEVVD